MEKRNNRQQAQDQDDKNRKPKRIQKKKVCQFCQDKIGEVDYKDVVRLRRFITEKGKMVPRRASGACAYHQRELSMAIKRARQMALLPYKAE